MIKVVHITKLPDGGATWCAMRISNALSEQGIESRMLLMQGTSTDSISIAQPDWLYRERRNIISRITLKILKCIYRPIYERLKRKRNEAERTGKAFFTSPLTGYTNLVNHPWVKEADIIHLHWISDFVDLPSFFKHINKPVVWTLHDENPGLGGFHYVSAKENCSSEYKNLDNIFAAIKHKALRSKTKPVLVAISSMMQNFINNNDILKDCKNVLIHNGVDCDKYKYKNRMECRKEICIPADRKVFLFSSYMIEDKRKGLSLLIKALESFNDEKITLVCLGLYNAIPKTTIDIHCVGLISSSENLSTYYSAADYFVLSSFQEGFAQTPLEAMSCGIPVISFPCSGASDLIRDYNGVLCDDFSVESLIKGIQKAETINFNRSLIRRKVYEQFSYDKIANQYIDLYKSLL